MESAAASRALKTNQRLPLGAHPVMHPRRQILHPEVPEKSTTVNARNGSMEDDPVETLEPFKDAQKIASGVELNESRTWSQRFLIAPTVRPESLLRRECHQERTLSRRARGIQAEPGGFCSDGWSD